MGRFGSRTRSATRSGGSRPPGVSGSSQFPTPSSARARIAVGPDGALWFTEYFGNNIGRITTTGSMTDFRIPTANATPEGIALGPDGALWFTEAGANKIGQMTTTGSFSEFPIPTAGSFPRGIAAGPDGAPQFIVAAPDGAMWFTEGSGDKIGRITSRPTSKDQCKNGGWRTFPGFKNRGDCVSFVATGGKNPPSPAGA